MDLRIEPWAGQAGVARQLARRHVREWADVFPGWTERKAADEFEAQLAAPGLPATWLAFDGDTLIGSISALLEDAPEFNDIPGPWLASFYIVPEARGNGVAQALMQAAGKAVAALGYREWYLFTGSHDEYYAKYGWVLLERRELHGLTVALMRQELPAGG